MAKSAASTYVGGDICAGCHTDAATDWQGSHHDLAMQVASAQTMLGDFNDATFSYNGITSTFYRDGERFMVRTDGADGKLHDYAIKYTFGVAPLQQYLIEFDDGRVQALGIAWDSRPKNEGGQRWFHLYPDQNVDHRHFLHWTARDQNWNYMCAECHSTNLHKNYDATSDTYRTSYSEINVACEACHGPGSAHVAWAQQGQKSTAGDLGLIVRFDERRGAHWALAPGASTTQRSPARATSKELDTCARCHSRRNILSENFVHGRPIGDTHRIALLDREIYFADGQPNDETYVYGSFLQSRMFHAGVTCSDCHNPHSLQLKLPGDQVCGQCHLPATFATPAHHHHPLESEGARCVSCHMPVNTYMVVDDRRDHSFRVPRPDLSVAFGTPNSCNKCHADRDANWAATQVRQWLGRDAGGFQHYTATLHGARNGDPALYGELLKLLNDDQPAIARATAVSLLPGYPAPRTLDAMVRMTQDPNPLLRRAAAEALEATDPATRARWLPALLDDAVLDVRLSAARTLAAVDPQQLPPPQRERLRVVLDEYIATQQLNADRPEAWLNLGALRADQGDAGAAEAAYRKALQLDPGFVPAIANLVDLYRATGRDALGAELLKSSLQQLPEAATLHYLEGLLAIRQKQYAAALESLALAAQLAPEDARFAYVHAVLLHESGDARQALERLEANANTHPFDRDTLAALVGYAEAEGNEKLAAKYRTRLQALQQLTP